MFTTLGCASTVLALFGAAGPAAGQGPGISISPPSKNFGVVKAQATNIQSFTVQNNVVRRAQLQVQLSSSSPCATLNKTSLDIGQGKSGTFSVRLASTPGLCQATITASGSGFSATAAVTGQVTKITAAPQQVQFQKLNVGQNQSQTVNIKNEGPAQLNCALSVVSTGVNLGGENFSVSPASLALGPNQQAAATVTFAAQDLEQMTGSSAAAFLQLNCGGALNNPVTINLAGSFNTFKVTLIPGNSLDKLFSYNVQVSGNAAAAAGGGVKCGVIPAFPNHCQGLVTPGTQVTASPNPIKGVFAKWEGTGSAGVCTNSTAPNCCFTVTADSTLQAR
jgi:hypothetical protein